MTKKIIYIDDERSALVMVKIMLEHAGFEAHVTSNGTDGLAYIRQHLPNLIICDLKMPPPDGFEILAELKQDSSLKKLPFVFLTAYGSADGIEQALKLGADDFVSKPIHPQELILRINTILARQLLYSDGLKTSVNSVGKTIFLSYSRQDIMIMQRIQATLKSHQLEVWVDEEGLEPGEPSWKRAVQNAIDKAGCVVAIFSPDAKLSQWVEAELHYAETQGKIVFPILARGNPGNAIPFSYTLTQRTDIVSKDYDSEMAKLINAIRKHLNLMG